MAKGIMIGLLILWALFVTFIAMTALLGSFRNWKELEAIRSWCPICKMKIPEEEKHESV